MSCISKYRKLPAVAQFTCVSMLCMSDVSSKWDMGSLRGVFPTTDDSRDVKNIIIAARDTLVEEGFLYSRGNSYYLTDSAIELRPHLLGGNSGPDVAPVTVSAGITAKEMSDAHARFIYFTNCLANYDFIKPEFSFDADRTLFNEGCAHPELQVLEQVGRLVSEVENIKSKNVNDLVKLYCTLCVEWNSNPQRYHILTDGHKLQQLVWLAAHSATNNPQEDTDALSVLLHRAAVLPCPGSSALPLDPSWSAPRRLTVLATATNLGLCVVRKKGSQLALLPTPITQWLVTRDTHIRPSRAEMELRANQVPDMTRGQATVLVENNFRIYLYGSMPTDQRALTLCSSIFSQSPVLTTGQITYYSFCRAYYNGISADDIISWLERHAHPARALTNEVLDKERCADGEFCAIPVNVRDQLHLWKDMINPLREARGVLFKVDVNLGEARAKKILEKAWQERGDEDTAHPWLLWPDMRRLQAYIDPGKSEHVSEIVVVESYIPVLNNALFSAK